MQTREARKQTEAMLGEHAKTLERERNAVEDVWESRWRDRMALVDKEASRKLKERDEAWLQFLSEGCPEIVGKVKDALFSVHDTGRP